MKKILSLLFTFLIFACSVQIVFADASMPTFINPISNMKVQIPGMVAGTPVCTGSMEEKNQVCKFPWIGNYIQGVYTYGLGIAGILATVIMMFGGVLWLTSAGNAQQVGEAKAWITGATTGLLLLFCTFLIMNTVNPELTTLRPISVGMVSKEPDNEPETTELNTDSSTNCNNCSTIPATIPIKNGNQLNKDLITKLQAVSSTVSWAVTEAYPPSSTHKSKCHYNGMCLDVGIRSTMNCANVNTLISAFQSAGFKVLNEFMSCNGTQTTYTTGGHLHVQ